MPRGAQAFLSAGFSHSQLGYEHVVGPPEVAAAHLTSAGAGYGTACVSRRRRRPAWSPYHFLCSDEFLQVESGQLKSYRGLYPAFILQRQALSRTMLRKYVHVYAWDTCHFSLLDCQVQKGLCWEPDPDVFSLEGDCDLLIRTAIHSVLDCQTSSWRIAAIEAHHTWSTKSSTRVRSCSRPSF